MTEKGKQLKIACLREGIYQKELARMVGIDPSLISKAISGERPIKSEKNKKIIARLLDKPIELLFD